MLIRARKTLILCKGPTNKLEDTKIIAEGKYSINFSEDG